MGYRLGVDLGTTFTSAATSSDGSVSILDLGKDSAQIPSVLFVGDDESFLVGRPAERRGILEPDRVVREFKRRVGDPVPIVLAGSPYSAQSLMSVLLRWVVAQATERLGEPPSDLVVTYPANWGPYKKELLTQSLRLADQPDARTLTEPAAAARLYASRTKVQPGEIVAVYDLGGGTFDAALLRKQEEGFELLGSPEGIEQLGGIDFDEAVFAHVFDAIRDRISDLQMDDPDSRVAIARLRRDCVEAKETLSVDTDVTIPVLLPGLSTSVRLDRSEFEDMIRPALYETMRAMRRAIASARMDPSDIKAVVLIGGSSRIPLVTEMLTEEFGRPIALDTHPKNDVSMGAAMEEGVPQAVLEPSILQPQVPDPTVTRPTSGDQPKTRERPLAVAAVTQPTRPKRRLVWIVLTGILVVGAGVVGTLALQNTRDADVSAAPVVSESAPTEQSAEPPGPTLTPTPTADDRRDPDSTNLFGRYLVGDCLLRDYSLTDCATPHVLQVTAFRSSDRECISAGEDFVGRGATFTTRVVHDRVRGPEVAPSLDGSMCVTALAVPGDVQEIDASLRRAVSDTLASARLVGGCQPPSTAADLGDARDLGPCDPASPWLSGHFWSPNPLPADPQICRDFSARLGGGTSRAEPISTPFDTAALREREARRDAALNADEEASFFVPRVEVRLAGAETETFEAAVAQALPMPLTKNHPVHYRLVCGAKVY